MPIKSLNIWDPVVLESDLSTDYRFAFYTQIMWIINDNGRHKYILWDGKPYELTNLRTPTIEEMISYFWAISNPTRLRMRQIMERSE